MRDGAYVTDPVLSDGAATYTPGISEKRGTTTTYLHHGLKNAEAQSQSASTNSAEVQYDAFGNQTGSTGTWNGPFGYAGGFGYQGDDTGLMLLGHRYYDSSVGRFLTPDPIKDGSNWYAYCENNPLSSYDDDGYQQKELSKDAPKVLGKVGQTLGKDGGFIGSSLLGMFGYILGTVLFPSPRGKDVKAPVRPNDVVIWGDNTTGRRDDHSRIYPGQERRVSKEDFDRIMGGKNVGVGANVTLVGIFIPPDIYIIKVIPRTTPGVDGRDIVKGLPGGGFAP